MKTGGRKYKDKYLVVDLKWLLIFTQKSAGVELLLKRWLYLGRLLEGGVLLGGLIVELPVEDLLLGFSLGTQAEHTELDNC